MSAPLFPAILDCEGPCGPMSALAVAGKEIAFVNCGPPMPEEVFKMPEKAGCEVIGCYAEAEWVCREKGDIPHEELLCRVCWTKLYRRKPAQAARYAALT